MAMKSAVKGHGAPVRFLKSKFRTTVLVLFFLFSFSLLKYLPGMYVTSEIWFVTVFIFLVMIYLPARLMRRFECSSLELYGVFLLLYMPLVSAFMANGVFGQPWTYGILAQRSSVLVGCMMMFLHFYRMKSFSLKDVESALLWLAWLNLLFCSVGLLTLDPNQFSDMPGFVGGDGIGGKKLTFPVTFIVFGFFYYAFSGYWRKNLLNLFLSLLFFSYLVLGSGGRMLLVAVVCSYLFFIGRWISMGRLLFYLSNMVLLAVLVTIFYYIIGFQKFDSLYFDSLYLKFNAAVSVVVTGDEGEDSSANARISESNIALTYVKKYWLPGTGLISNQWHGGYKALLGYFHPSDIGLLGIIFLYGVLGLVVFAYQFHFALRYSKLLPRNGGHQGKLVSAVKGFLLYYAISSFTTSAFAVSAEHGLIFITILYCAAQIDGFKVRQCLVLRVEP
jgi:hypothetical protein